MEYSRPRRMPRVLVVGIGVLGAVDVVLLAVGAVVAS